MFAHLIVTVHINGLVRDTRRFLETAGIDFRNGNASHQETSLGMLDSGIVPSSRILHFTNCFWLCSLMQMVIIFQVVKEYLYILPIAIAILLFHQTKYVYETLLFSLGFRKEKSLDGKYVLITGAANGLGQALSVRVAKLGAHVIGWDIDWSGLCQTRDMVNQALNSTKPESSGVAMRIYQCNVADPEAVASCAYRVLEECGIPTVDILINNAAFLQGKTLLQSSDSDIQKTLATNLLASFWTTRRFLTRMHSRHLFATQNNGCSTEAGHLVFIGSVAGEVSGTCQVADYCASKAALHMFVECLSLELHQMRMPRHLLPVTLVAPFVFDSRLFAGFQTKLPSVLPMVPVDVVADRVVMAIRRNEYLVHVPSVTCLLPVVRLFAPLDGLIAVYRWIGSMSAMDNWKGVAS